MIPRTTVPEADPSLRPPDDDFVGYMRQDEFDNLTNGLKADRKAEAKAAAVAAAADRSGGSS